MEGLMYYLEWVNKLSLPGQDGITGFVRDFMKLKDQTQSYKDGDIYPTTAGDRPENKKKNRYKDILPYDYCRVDLLATDNVPGSDYINASYIKGAFGRQSYIAAQGPLPHTVNDYWRMLLDINAQTVVMVCREIEHGKHKCERYWPDVGQEKKYGDITVTLLSMDRISEGFLCRKMKAVLRNRELTVTQYQYTSWPDHGTPEDVSVLLKLIDTIRETHHDQSSVPVVVHCSAGCGRTGVVLAIDYARGLLKSDIVPKKFNMFDVISDMRKQRNAIVQTKDQYVFVCKTVSELVLRSLRHKKGTKMQTEWIRKNSLILFPETNTSESSDEEEVIPSRKVSSQMMNAAYKPFPVSNDPQQHPPPPPKQSAQIHSYVNLVFPRTDAHTDTHPTVMGNDPCPPPLPVRKTSVKNNTDTPPAHTTPPPTQSLTTTNNNNSVGLTRQGSVGAKSNWFRDLNSGPVKSSLGEPVVDSVKGVTVGSKTTAEEPPPIHPKLKAITEMKPNVVPLPAKKTSVTGETPKFPTHSSEEIKTSRNIQPPSSKQEDSRGGSTTQPSTSRLTSVAKQPPPTQGLGRSNMSQAEGQIQLRHRRYENFNLNRATPEETKTPLPLKPKRSLHEQCVPPCQLDAIMKPVVSASSSKWKTHPPTPPMHADKHCLASLGPVLNGKASYLVNQHTPIEHHLKQVHLDHAVPHRAVFEGGRGHSNPHPADGIGAASHQRNQNVPALYATPYESIFPTDETMETARPHPYVFPKKSRSLDTRGRNSPSADQSFYAVADVVLRKGADRPPQRVDLHRSEDHMIRAAVCADEDYALPTQLFTLKPPVPDRTELSSTTTTTATGPPPTHRSVRKQVATYEDIVVDGVIDDDLAKPSNQSQSTHNQDRTSNSTFYVSAQSVDDSVLRRSNTDDLVEQLYSQPVKRRGSLDSQTVQRIRRNSSIEYSVIPPQVPDRTEESFQLVDEDLADFKKSHNQFYKSMRSKFGAKLQFLHNVLPIEFPKKLGLRPKGPREPKFVKR